ncbi:probable carboxylesterase 17 [Magnolia sinica]|uniref:probable carboxylesterase 17 n=1 Tax=Magnolia sinica TaxID=86752 RepID=UPI00265B66D4|nr:probable carboxylesterase 17 [Magnolia sinica]
MRRRRMGALSLSDQRSPFVGKDHNQNAVVVDEIQGLIKVYKDGRVDRSPVVQNVACSYGPEADVASRDVKIDGFNGVWARFYVPKHQANLPLLIYFHGGGFCIGSAAWRCYHEFLALLASRAGCLIMSVDYRLAPENRLPAAYDDGLTAVKWVRQQALNGSEEQSWWWSRCNFSKVYLGGDSAGACVAHHVATRLELPGVSQGTTIIKPFCLQGLILLQPFFGGEARTPSERNMVQPSNSALTLTTSDVYWRLALPVRANRDHPWCNPLAKGSTELEYLKLPSTLVCIAEMDILKDRNMEFCAAMKQAGKTVEYVVYSGVGHAFQVLYNSPMSQARTYDMISHIKSFINC